MHRSSIDYRWAISTCRKYKFVAANFGFGPSVAADRFAKRNQITLEGWHSSITDNSLQTYPCLANFGVFDYVSKDNCKIWLDCLMWLRKKLPEVVRSYDFALGERFFPTRPGVLKTQIKYIEVAPLIERSMPIGASCSSGDSPLVVLSFGGIITPFSDNHTNTIIPEMMIDALGKLLVRFHQNARYVVCLPQALLEEIAYKKRPFGVEFKSPNPAEYMALMGRAQLLVLQPGLYGPFEAFLSGKHVIFCPAFSYTQTMQFREYVKWGLARRSPFSDLIDSAIGSLNGDIEGEEPRFFAALSSLLRCHPAELEQLVSTDPEVIRGINALSVDVALQLRREQHANSAIALESNRKSELDYVAELFPDLQRAN